MAENVDRFRELVDLAQSGDIQSATDKVGPFRVNPYYYEDPHLLSTVGYFMNVITPLMHEHIQEDSHGVSIYQIISRDSSENKRVSRNGGESLILADRAGYIYTDRETVEEDGAQVTKTLYKPTKAILDIEVNKLFVGKYTSPETRGCLGALAIGLPSSIVAYNTLGRPLLAISAGTFAIAAGGKLSEKHGKILAGREAYRHYQQST